MQHAITKTVSAVLLFPLRNITRVRSFLPFQDFDRIICFIKFWL
uniref:Uncharacterized protein n=1 Tax=Anguilla anguilla TaxID=7936 RepID=A0A0E9S6E6_ANGAN